MIVMHRDYEDNELLFYISENNEEASNIMFDKYTPLINSIANDLIKYAKNSGLELNDLVQEGMIGLDSAIKTYSDNKDSSFYTYAKHCIKRRIISLVIGSNRQKHRLLNESVSLNASYDEDLELEDHLGDNSYNPEICLFDQERIDDITNEFRKELTNLEEEVFVMRINGFNYKEIAELLEKDPKAIDNALQRIKSKLKKYLEKSV